MVLGISLALSATAAALIEREIITDPLEFFQFSFGEHTNTGFSMRGLDGSALKFQGTASFDPESRLDPENESVQDGFVLLDGTLALNVAAISEDGTRTRARTTYLLDVNRRSLQRDSIARKLFNRGLVRDLDRARTRARHMGVRDARVMRLVEREGSQRWIRAVRARRSPGRIVHRGRQAPTGILGQFGFDESESRSPYVWAVIDRSTSRYAVGLTVDRDNDGVPNSLDNCVGMINANQSNFDGDAAGDACDLDDDNDEVFDTADNCPLAANTDQQDLDKDGAGDACDSDDDNDNVPDGKDKCIATAIGSVVDATGCSIADSCPCEGGWRRGAFMKCTAQTSGFFDKAGLIAPGQKDAIITAAAKSSCGF